jgi:hypothetical protein
LTRININHQGGDANFSFIVPGPPGLRQELGENKLTATLEELGLAPSASLTVQVHFAF